jgi:enoyl-CoA hydratase/carnithine racemase
MTTTPTNAVITERSGAVQLIELNRPDKSNAVTFAMYDDLTAAISHAEQDSAIRVMLIHGRGDSFTAGNDLGDFLRNPPTSADLPPVRFLHALSQATKPIVAAVQGYAVGVGTTMLFHCDLVYAAPDARFMLPFVNLGLVPEGASSYLLPRVAGYQRAAEAIMLGAPLDAATMHQFGLVTGIVPKETLLANATAAAQSLSEKPAEGLRATKRLMKQATAQAIAAAIDAEAQEFVVRLQSPEAKEALTAFLEKRPPQHNRSSG